MNKKNRDKTASRNRRYVKLMTSAEQKFDSGQYASVADLMTDAVALEPDRPEAWHSLGAAFYFMADLEKAAEAFERAASLNSKNFSYINDLGGIYLAQRKFEEAERAFLAAEELEPSSIEVRYNLATCLSEQRKYQSAIPLLRSVVAASPELVEAKFNLGLVLRKIGKANQAIPWLEEVLSAGIPMAQLELARCYRDSRNWEKAKLAYSRVSERLVNEVVVAEYAETIYLNGDTEEALAYLEKLRDRIRGPAQRLELLMADIYLNSGEIDKARALVENLVAAGDSEHYLNAVDLLLRMQTSSELDENLKDELLSRLGFPNSNTEELAALNFTIAKLYDNASCFNEATEYYLEANRLKSQRISYQAEVQEKIVGSIIEFFSRDTQPVLLSDNDSDYADEEIKPVFVIGLPRSGTTLVEQILAGHSAVDSAGELGFFSNTAHNIKEMFSLQESYPSALSRLSSDQIQSLKRTYLSLLKRHDARGTFVTDKMPENFLHVGFIRLLFPKAPIIQVKRELCDVAISIFMQNFEQGNRYAFSMENIAHYFVQYEQLMRFWHSRGDSQLFQIQYEDLVKEPETVSRELFNFLQQPWQAGCLEFYRNKTDVRTASNWQVRQPLYDSSVGRACNYPDLKELFDNQYRNFRASLG